MTKGYDTIIALEPLTRILCRPTGESLTDGKSSSPPYSPPGSPSSSG